MISRITNAYIRLFSEFPKTALNLSLNELKILEDCKYLLIIHSITEESLRLTIYPINRQNIIKITLFGGSLSSKIFKRVTKILQKFQVIHTSGFLKIKKNFFFECYLNLSLSEEKSKDLKASLDNIKNIFKEIKIEEIGLINI
ncbi:MAG: hypothetical protein ACFFB0_17065 [Promethearchaeota archaeon]